ncbi:phenylalanine--tRNA ligase subunit beta [Methanobacterium sp. ACI-7]|uniref:phenylalanine--tRNA ligase subunit beta n=1 Tax=unclassified Methanobacterium TaxID=2627676 RepID=UPI0039C28745
MPVITFNYEDLYEILGTEIDKEKLIKLLPMIGSDIDDYDEEMVKVEFFPNRPDHLSVEGVARTLKGFLDIKKGIPEYGVEDSGVDVTVDEEIKNIRPYISFGIIENVDLRGDKLKQIMDFQEDLHWVIGRDRKKVAIGIHNLDVIKAPFYYKAADPDNDSFVPLEMDDEMNLRQILEDHKKGVKYAHLIDKFDKYPLIVDSEGNVLSMPPIINGEFTKLTEDTKDILVDVTGTDEKAVNYALNIIMASFAEVGGRLKSLNVVYSDRTVKTPDLTPKKKEVRIQNAEKIIGIDLSASDIMEYLSKVRIGAETKSDDVIEAIIPAYRVDILHEVDVIENIAVGYCFNKLEPELPEIATTASENKGEIFDNLLREILTGMGFLETMSLMLTSERQHYQNMLLEEDERVTVAQPISVDRTMLRKNLLQGLMEFLEDNKHEELPQKIFEVGKVVYLDKTCETCTTDIKKIAGAITHSTANFTEIKSIVDAIFINLGLKMELEKYNHPSFIKGRCAKVKGFNNWKSADLNVTGYFGELSPEVITNFDLEYPVIAFELEFN